MSSNTIELAIVGAGGISRAHISAAKATGGRVRIAAVVDPAEANRKAAADAAGGAGSFATFEELLKSDAGKNLRGVVVCTPPSARLPIVRAALERKLGVLVEKPIAHTYADAQAHVELAGKHRDVVTAVGYCHRFTPAVLEMKRMMAAGELGTVTRFENTFAAPLPHMQGHWMSDPAVSGGGSFIDTGCHSLDLFLFLCGKATVDAANFHYAWPGRGESSTTVLVRSPEKVAGAINTGWLEPARFLVTVVGTKGLIQYDYEKATELFFRPNQGDAKTIAVEPHDLRFQRQLEAFAEALASGGKGREKLASFADGLETARVVDEANRIARKSQ